MEHSQTGAAALETKTLEDKTLEEFKVQGGDLANADTSQCLL